MFYAPLLLYVAKKSRNYILSNLHLYSSAVMSATRAPDPNLAKYLEILAARTLHPAADDSCVHDGCSEVTRDAPTVDDLSLDGAYSEKFDAISLPIAARSAPRKSPVASPLCKSSSTESDEEAVPSLSLPVRTALAEFRELQRERVHTYRSFDECVSALYHRADILIVKISCSLAAPSPFCSGVATSAPTVR